MVNKMFLVDLELPLFYLSRAGDKIQIIAKSSDEWWEVSSEMQNDENIYYQFPMISRRLSLAVPASSRYICIYLEELLTSCQRKRLMQSIPFISFVDIFIFVLNILTLGYSSVERVSNCFPIVPGKAKS